MAKTASKSTKPAEKKEAKKQTAPDLAQVIKETQEQEAAIKAEQAEKLAKVRETQEAAKAAAQELLAPFITKVEAVREKALAAIKERSAAHEAVDAKFQPQLDKFGSALESIIEEAVETTGYPADVLAALGMHTQLQPTKRRRSGGGGPGRKSLRVGELGVFGPVTITAPQRRTSDPMSTKTVTLVLEGMADPTAPQGYVIKAKRVDDGDGHIDQAKMAGDYTHESAYMDGENYRNNISKVTTQPGWVETKDAQCAILASTGRVGEFPTCQPASDPSEVYVGDEPLTSFGYESPSAEETAG